MKLQLTFALAGALATALPAVAANTPKPVDFSFSLECRALRGAANEPLPMSVDDYEKAYAEAKNSGDLRHFYDITKGTVHEKNVRFAYVHGELDDGSDAWLMGTYVAEVTGERVFIKGQKEGDVDRRTGHAVLLDRALHQQYSFECEPSKPAKF